MFVKTESSMGNKVSSCRQITLPNDVRQDQVLALPEEGGYEIMIVIALPDTRDDVYCVSLKPDQSQTYTIKDSDRPFLLAVVSGPKTTKAVWDAVENDTEIPWHAEN